MPLREELHSGPCLAVGLVMEMVMAMVMVMVMAIDDGVEVRHNWNCLILIESYSSFCSIAYLHPQ